MSEESAAAAIHALLGRRAAGRTICPSDAARLIVGTDNDWRAQMDAVHQAVDTMLAAGIIELSWKGNRLDRRRGAYRIALRQSADRD